MAHFCIGLNHEIADVVELQHYVEMCNLVDKAIKAGKQLKARRLKVSSSSSNRVSWRHNPTFEEKNKRTAPKPKELMKSKGETSHMPQPRSKSKTQQRSGDLKCFRYQDIGHIAS